MIVTKQIFTLKELQGLMPLFLEGYAEMNKRYKAFDCTQEGFVKTLIGVLGTSEKNVIGVAYDGDEAVGYGVGFDDTPAYCEERHFLLWALYARPAYSRLAGKALFDGAEAFAKSKGYTKLGANNGRFNGSSLKYFERVLGMRRSRVEFTKTIL